MNTKKLKILIQNNKRQSQDDVKNDIRIRQIVNDPVRIEKKMKKVYSKQRRRNKSGIIKKNYQHQPQPQPQQIKPFIPPIVEEIMVPDWFKQTNPIQISIIVPLFKSKEYIQDQIRNWPLELEGLSTELIYVDDCCPEQTFSYIVKEWRNRSKSGIGKILKHDKNSGFGPTCNSGANVASGDFLIFLNADTVVTPNWIKPMYERLINDFKIGIVGNLHLDGSRAIIDSAGSEWSWRRQSFLHIGRSVYLGQELVEPIKYNKIPQDLSRAGPRDMVTGACFIIRKKLFNDIGQFDINYRIGYWEDSDLCMKVKDVGFQIWYEPKSIIYHKVGKSQGGGHPYRNHNKQVFKNKWIDNFKVDKFCRIRPGLTNIPMSVKDNVKNKVVGCVIALNEEEFLEASVDSVSPLIDEWIFVIGGNEYAYKAKMCSSTGMPLDSTLEIAYELAKKYNGVVIEPPGRLWKDKIEMRNAYATRLKPEEWMFMLDGDEVYEENQLWKVTELMNKYEVLIMQFWVFWNNINTIGTGKWDQYKQERVVKWKKGYGYRGKIHLNVTGPDSIPVHTKSKTWRGNDRLFYHYSWVRPIEKIRQKLEYYKHQSGNDNSKYVDEVFLKWRINSEAVRGKTHPMGGGDWATFNGTHPPQIKRLIEQGKLNF